MSDATWRWLFIRGILLRDQTGLPWSLTFKYIIIEKENNILANDHFSKNNILFEKSD